MKSITKLNKQNRRSLIFILFLFASWAIGNAMNLMDYAGGDTSQVSFTLNSPWTAIFLFIITGVVIFKHRRAKAYIGILMVVFLQWVWIAFLVYLRVNLMLILAIFGVALILTLLFSSGLGKKSKLYFGFMISASLGLLAFFLIWGGERRRFNLFDLGGRGGDPISLSPWEDGSGAMNAMSQDSGFIILGIILIAGITIFLYQKREMFSSSSEEKEESELEEDLSSTVDRAINDLSKGKDVESTIRRCYYHMCLLLEEKGASNEDFMTPREFEKYALAKLSVSSSKISEIRSLFEKVKYSSHEFDEGHRKTAVKDLKELREELG